MPADTARPAPRPLPIDAVLFDLDGTLADTAGDLPARSNRARAERACLPCPWPVCAPTRRPAARAAARRGHGHHAGGSRLSGTARSVSGHYAACLADTTVLFPAWLELLDAIERRGLRWGIVTNKFARFTGPVLSALALSRQRASMVVSGDTTPHPKPHPAPLLHAATGLKLPPSRCMYVGDDLRDISRGQRRGHGDDRRGIRLHRRRRKPAMHGPQPAGSPIRWPCSMATANAERLREQVPAFWSSHSRCTPPRETDQAHRLPGGQRAAEPRQRHRRVCAMECRWPARCDRPFHREHRGKAAVVANRQSAAVRRQERAHVSDCATMPPTNSAFKRRISPLNPGGGLQAGLPGAALTTRFGCRRHRDGTQQILRSPPASRTGDAVSLDRDERRVLGNRGARRNESGAIG